MKKLVVLCVVALSAATLLAYGDPPKTMDTIPVYPGAVKGAVSHDWPQAMTPNAMLTDTVTYTVAAWPEEVFAWYQKQLGGMNDAQAWEAASKKTALGAVSQALYHADPVTAAQEKDLTTTRTVQDNENHVVGKWDGAWVKGALQSRPRTADRWQWGGTFAWVYNRSPKSAPLLKVAIDFGSSTYLENGHATGPIDGVNKTLTKTVTITFSYQTQAPDWWAKTDKLDDAGKAKLVAMYNSPPTERDLGVPIYPGAELDFNTLITNSGMIGYLFPYDANDPVAKVVAFYEKATGKKAQEQSKGSYGILLKGEQKAPQLAVSFMDMTALLTEEQRQLMSKMGAAQPAVLIAVSKDLDKRKLSDADAARFDALKKTPPTEKDLGAPLYPGAALDYDALQSAMMAGGWSDKPDYPYSVAAPTDKVLDFYKTKAGRPPMTGAGQSVFTFSSGNIITAVAVGAGPDAKTTAIEYRVNTIQGMGSGTQSLADDAAKAKFLQVCKTGTAQDIQAAIKAGAAVNPDKPFMGITPLKQAVVFNPSYDAIMALLKAGADARAQGGLGDTVLAEAANHITDLDFLKALIKAGADANGANPDIHHALIAAANLNLSPAVVELLLANGADLKAADKYGVTPFRAIQPNAKLFGTSVYWRIADASGETLLDLAAYASPEVMQAAIGHGAKVDVKNDKGKTPLLVAAQNNPDPAVVQLLIKSGANAKATDADGINALQYAVGVSATTAGMNQQLSTAASAMNSAAITMATGSLSGRPIKPAGAALGPATGIPEKVTALINAGAPVNAGDKNGMTPLHCAIKSNESAEVINALLKAGADIESKVGANVAQPQTQAPAQTQAPPPPPPAKPQQGGGLGGMLGGLLGGAAKAAQNAAQGSAQNTAQSATQNAAQGAANKAISGAGEASGMTPLILACYTAADNDRIDALLKAKAKVNATDDAGRTALLAAAGRDYEAIPLLIAAGAQVSVTDKKGMTPLLMVFAPRKEDIGATIGAALTLTGSRLKVTDPATAVQTLLKAGAQPNVADADGRTPLIYAASSGNVDLVNQLLAAGAQVNVADKNGTTPLLAAVTANAADIVSALLKAGAQVNVADKKGMTPLLVAVAAQRQDSAPVISALLKAGAQVNVADADGRTPLMYVAASANVDLLTQFVSAGARVEAADRAGLTPLMYAVGTEVVDPVQLLLDKGAKPNTRDRDGLTAYLWAVRTHGLAMRDTEEPNPVLAPLMKAGADPNAKDNKGRGAPEWDKQNAEYGAELGIKMGRWE